MDFNSIDWDAMWREEAKFSSRKSISEKEIWDKRADSYDRRNNGSETPDKLDKEDYVSKMLDRIALEPEWTVLDIGSGPGTLTIPLARKAKNVTALDVSPAMLAKLQNKTARQGIRNIRYINSSWQDAFAKKQVGIHDVVVASRSLMTDDIKEALSNIIAVTGKAAYLTFPVIHLPFDWEVYRVIGRRGKKHPPYIYAYNLLYQMGIQANVEILCSKVTVRFVNVEEALEVLQRRNDPFNDAEIAKLKEFLEMKFAGLKGSSVFTHEGKSKWALIWWRKDDQEQCYSTFLTG